MSCLICLEKNNNIIKIRNCSCKLNLHHDCYINFLKQTNKNCPICRDKRIKETNDSLFNIIFKFPAPIAVISWFLLSFIIFFFYILPMLIFREIRINFIGGILIMISYSYFFYLILKIFI